MYICIVDNQDLYTAGTVEIYACGDMNPVRDSAQEAYKYLDYGQFTFDFVMLLNVGSIYMKLLTFFVSILFFLQER